jgi:hypothetical protein
MWWNWKETFGNPPQFNLLHYCIYKEMDYAIDVLFKQVLVPMEHRQECHIKIEIFRIQDDEVDLEKL